MLRRALHPEAAARHAVLRADPGQRRVVNELPPLHAVLDDFFDVTASVETSAPYAFVTSVFTAASVHRWNGWSPMLTTRSLSSATAWAR